MAWAVASVAWARVSVGSWLVQNNLTVVVDLSRVLNVFPYPPRSFRMYK